MTVPVPPPHLLKKFSAQARESSQKRGAPNYLKTFATLCIEWAMNSKPTPNPSQIRSSEIKPKPELVQQWLTEFFDDGAAIAPGELSLEIANRAAQWGADQELEACCEYIEQWVPSIDGLDPSKCLCAARRPKPPSLNQLAMQMLSTIERDAHYLPEITDTIRRALEQLPQ